MCHSLHTDMKQDRKLTRTMSTFFQNQNVTIFHVKMRASYNLPWTHCFLLCNGMMRVRQHWWISVEIKHNKRLRGLIILYIAHFAPYLNQGLLTHPLKLTQAFFHHKCWLFLFFLQQNERWLFQNTVSWSSWTHRLGVYPYRRIIRHAPQNSTLSRFL